MVSLVAVNCCIHRWKFCESVSSGLVTELPDVPAGDVTCGQRLFRHLEGEELSNQTLLSGCYEVTFTSEQL